MRRIVTIAGSALCLITTFAAMASESPPVAVVERLHEALTQASGGYIERYQALAPVVRQTHDLTGIARISLGSHWRRLDADQRERFVELLTKFNIAMYARRFPSDASVEFSAAELQQAGDGQALVSAQLQRSGKGDVRFQYQLRETDSGWRILNVIADGVSNLAIRRSEYAGIIQRQGFEALINRIQERLDGFRSGAAGADGDDG